MPVKQIGETDTQSRDLATGAWVFGLSNGAGGQTVSDGPTLVRAKITFSATSSVYEVTVRTNSGGAYATYFEEFTSGSPEVYILTNEVLIEDEDVFNVYIRSQSGSDTAVSVTAKLYDVCAFMSATDGKALISTYAQDLSATLDVNTKLIEAADPSDTINAAVDAALDTAIPGSPTANSINERIKTLDDAYTATRAAYLDELKAANLPADVDTILADVTADEGHSTKVDYHSTRLG